MFFIISLCMFGCLQDDKEYNLYEYLIETINEFRSSPLSVDRNIPVVRDGWSVQEDETGVTISVNDPAIFFELDQFIRDVLGQPDEEWEEGDWVVYSAKKTGVMISYEKFDDPNGGVKIVILRQVTYPR